jgi:hypothetical protein
MWTLMSAGGIPRDEGMILIWVGFLMTALLGVGALVIDIGAMYVEKRQLQNGADAAALAVAQDCVADDCASAFATAQQYANLNAKDGAANVAAVCGRGPGLPACAGDAPPRADEASGWVRVGTSTRTADGSSELEFVLAPLIGAVGGTTVNAAAVAAWGPVGTAIGEPIVFSVCEFVLAGGSIEKGGSVPTGKHAVLFHDSDSVPTTCALGPAGKDVPGGFGFINETAPCEADLKVGQVVGASPGNSLSASCEVDTLNWHNNVQIFPIYDDVEGTGSGALYSIAGFVAVRITGYNFNGGANDWGDDCGASSSDTCIIGEFTAVSLEKNSGFTTGPDFGVRAVEMIG